MRKIADAVLPPVTDQGRLSFGPLGSGITRAAVYVMALISLSFIAWFRIPEISRGTLWAEDAAVFLQDTIAIGPLGSVMEPYAGYLHTIPRIISAIAVLIGPIESYAILVSYMSCFIVACVSLASYVLSRQIFQARSLRLMVAMIPVLVPIGPVEVLGNAANLHWYLLWLCPWLLVYEPRNLWSRFLLFAATLAAATTEIIVGIFVPLAVWAIVKRKNFWAAAGLAAGLGCQLLATISSPRYSEAPRLDSIEPLSLVYGFLLQAIGSIWETDSTVMAHEIVAFGGFAVAIPVTFVFGLLTFILVMGKLKWRAVALYSFFAAAICWTAAVLLNPTSEIDFANFTGEDWISKFTFFRYAAAPSMFLLVLVPLACAVAREKQLIGGKNSLYWAPLLMALFLSASYFQALSVRQTGPEWADSVAKATELCLADSSLPESIIPVTPAEWRVAIPCPLLTAR